MRKSRAIALLPVGVFLALCLGIIFEYALKIPMGFYNSPIAAPFPAALLVSSLAFIFIIPERQEKSK